VLARCRGSARRRQGPALSSLRHVRRHWVADARHSASSRLRAGFSHRRLRAIWAGAVLRPPRCLRKLRRPGDRRPRDRRWDWGTGQPRCRAGGRTVSSGRSGRRSALGTSTWAYPGHRAGGTPTAMAARRFGSTGRSIRRSIRPRSVGPPSARSYANTGWPACPIEVSVPPRPPTPRARTCRAARRLQPVPALLECRSQGGKLFAEI
jgi:hypothetical protein